MAYRLTRQKRRHVPLPLSITYALILDEQILSPPHEFSIFCPETVNMVTLQFDQNFRITVGNHHSHRMRFTRAPNCDTKEILLSAN